MSAQGGPGIVLQCCGASDTGLERSENQDSLVFADLSGGAEAVAQARSADGSYMLVRDFELGPLGALLMVADGMGGAAGGRVASKMATSHVMTSVSTQWAPDQDRSPERFIHCIEEAVRDANKLIHEQSTMHPAYHGMGTTATVAGVLDDYLFLAQIGDSRAYLVRGGRCVQLTWDQSFENYAVESGWMSAEEARRSVHRNTILQALGPEDSVDVDLTFQHLRRGDVLVLCSDGLFRVVNEDEIAGAVGDDLQAGCAALIETARTRGAPDNVTVLLVRFGGNGLSQPTREDFVGRQQLPERGA
jgi:serine/threonine protein phosphatase PrpC